MCTDSTAPAKVCTKCGRELPATTEFFHPRPERPCGIHSRCRDCKKAQQRAHKYASVSAKTRAERERRATAKRSETKVCVTCNRELPATTEFFAPMKRGIHGVRADCRECRNAYYREYQMKNRVRRLAQCRQWRQDHPEQAAASRKAWSEANSEKVSEYLRQWRKDNPEACRANGQNARARRRSVGGTHTAADMRAQLERQRGRCYWCGTKLTAYHVDHVVPIVLGGSNGPENIVVACPHCNQSKRAKHPMDWSGQMF